MTADVIDQLKKLEGKSFPTMAKLFDAVIAAGVPNLDGFRSGGRNRQLAEKELKRYLTITPTTEVDPTCKKPSARTITKVEGTPLPKEDNRGVNGKFVDVLKPLIMTCNSFKGKVDEFFSSIGVWEKYRSYVCFEQGDQRAGDNVWRTFPFMTPGEICYRGSARAKEQDILTTALNALQRERKLTWDMKVMYIPDVVMPNKDPGDKEWLKDFGTLQSEYEKRKTIAQRIASKCGCTLDPNVVEKTYAFGEDFDTLRWGDMEGYYRNCISQQRVAPLVASYPQMEEYKNFQKWERQVTVFLCDRTGEYSEPVPNPFQIFGRRAWFKQYTEIDQKLCPFVLGWKVAWRIIDFSLKEDYWDKSELSHEEASELSLRLTKLLVKYQDGQMDKKLFWADRKTLGDCVSHFGTPSPNCAYPLKNSRAAQSLHQLILGFYPLES